MASINTYSRADKRRESVDLTDIKIQEQYGKIIMGSLLHAVNNMDDDINKVTVLAGLLSCVNKGSVNIDDVNKLVKGGK